MSEKCLNCENMRKQLVVLEGALAISAEMANALKPLFPDPKLLSQEKRDQWQKVVNAVFKACDYADEFKLQAWGGHIEKVPVKITAQSVGN